MLNQTPPHSGASRAVRLACACALTALLMIGLTLAASAQSKDKSSKSPPTKDKSSKPGKTMPTEQRVVLLFPPDMPDKKSDAASALADIIASVEKSRLTASNAYRTVEFVTSLPTVRRALNEGTITTNDIKPPFDSGTKAKRLTSITGYPLALVSSIDDYSYDADKKVVSLVMSAKLIDFSGEKADIRAASESSTSGDKPSAGANEASLAEETARNLTEKLMSALLKPRTRTTAPPSGTTEGTSNKPTAGDAPKSKPESDKPAAGDTPKSKPEADKPAAGDAPKSKPESDKPAAGAGAGNKPDAKSDQGKKE